MVIINIVYYTNANNLIIVSNETCLNVSVVDDDVIVPVGSRLLVEEASGVHQLVNNQRHVNAALIQRHYLRPTRSPNVTVTPVVT